MIAAILLVPAEAHREALIGDGPCGSRAPVAWRYTSRPGGGWVEGPPPPGPNVIAGLVIAWDVKPVPDGLARLERQIGIPANGLMCRETLAAVLGWLEQLSARKLVHGRLVFLDADGREVAP